MMVHPVFNGKIIMDITNNGNSTWDSYYTLENRNSSKILGLQYDSREELIPTIQTTNTEAWSHMWILVEVD